MSRNYTDVAVAVAAFVAFALTSYYGGAGVAIVVVLGGFGSVYKGIFSNGTLVAVKVLRGTSDKRIDEQFMAEVSTLGRIHHFNVVRLHGFCFERHLRALVYEYMSNGSLDKFSFPWKQDFRI
ncbi:calcium/calmodulin-regulated receptor-like kinase 2 [Rosa chinensis]|uniref:calcium/calmodulin-regulated receptor-like kinase 2 n=1 Tax=Rosa chinensis TaxID=74649 RepID=UPI001AD917DF|nr:calcium/calmodulin-regulated receptor-like kinase 2 [Rosa chinensis]